MNIISRCFTCLSLLCVVLALTGCSGTFRRAYLGAEWHYPSFESGFGPEQERQELDLFVDATYTRGAGSAVFSDSSRVQSQSHALLSWIAEAREQAVEQTACEPEPMTWFLRQVEGFPRPLSYEVEYFTEDLGQVFPLPYADAGQTAADILKDNLYCTLPWAGYRQAIETVLIRPDELPIILPDLGRPLINGWLPWLVPITYHTRWFISGYSDYAAYVFTESLRQHASGAVPVPRLYPLKALSESGRKLWGWERGDSGPETSELESAAFGLFLYCQVRHGPEAISSIARACRKTPGGVDGKQLRRIWQDVTGEDPMAIAKRFHWPDPGLRWRLPDYVAEKNIADYDPLCISEVVEGSPAAKAGLRAGQIVTGCEGEAIYSLVDLELALLQAGWSEGKTVALMVRDGEIERELLLAAPAAP
jgi:hypothetical protein